MGHGNAGGPAVPGVLQDPIRNRGVEFTEAEREALGLTGRLPPAVLTLDQQARRAYQQLQAQGGDLAKNVYLEQLHDRNETLYFRLLSDHLTELLPIVYDPTVGEAIEKYSHEYRRPRGVFLSIDHPDDTMRDQKLVVFGAGTAGVGIADQLRDAMIRDGASQQDATAQVWLIDKQGLLTDDMAELRDYQRPYARKAAEVKGWGANGGPISLLDTVRNAAPTILLSTSTVHGAFTRDVVETMSGGTGRPIIFPISYPTSRIEAMPADIIAWSKGKALVATGIPVAPVGFDGMTYTIGQANNALLYPGLGLGTIVAGARRVTAGMLLAAAEAVASQVDVSAPGASLLPPVGNLRASSATTAVAVVRAAEADGVASKEASNPVQAVQDAMWQPVYPDGAA
jgi:malic enzyme